MARGRCRMIYDGIFSSADLIDLPAAARWMWLGMVVYADDNGLLRNCHEGWLQHTVLQGLRIGKHRIEHWLSILHARNMVSTCILDGVKCYQIRNFSRYQRLSRRNRTEQNIREQNRTEGSAPCTAPVDGIQTVEEFFFTDLCTEPHQAAEAIQRLGTTAADIPAWREALKAARTKGLRDPRSFVRSRALRFRTAAEAELGQADDGYGGWLNIVKGATHE